jgi:hypothetical protein
MTEREQETSVRDELRRDIQRKAKHDPSYAIAWALLELAAVIDDALTEFNPPPGGGR